MTLETTYEEFVQFEITDIIWSESFSGLAETENDRSGEPDDAIVKLLGEEDAEERQERLRQRYLANNTSITFEYSNPAVGIDTGGNFVKHDIIGGPTVRQKVGSQPMQISIKGIAKEETAKDLEVLRNAKQATLISDRFAEDAVTVHIVSVTTDPMEDGGAADIVEGEFLYSFSLECVEIANAE